jgi:hypothetical protein
MTPFQFEDEVLIHPVCANLTNGLPGTDQHSVFKTPRVLGRIDSNPPGEILSIEQISKFISGCLLTGNDPNQENKQPA